MPYFNAVCSPGFAAAGKPGGFRVFAASKQTLVWGSRFRRLRFMPGCFDPLPEGASSIPVAYPRYRNASTSSANAADGWRRLG